MAVTAEDYRALFRTHPAGVTIATTMDQGRPVGVTMTSAVSISAEPPLIMVSLQAGSSSWPAFSRAGRVMLHFLDAGQQALAARFATSGIDRFEGQDWILGGQGAPRLGACETWAACDVFGRHRVGSGNLLFLRPVEMSTRADRRPVVFSDRAFRQVGAAL